MTAPDKIYATILNGHVTMEWWDWREYKTDIEYVRADIHHAEVDALHAECDRLTKMLEPQKLKKPCWKCTGTGTVLGVGIYQDEPCPLCRSAD